MSTVVRPRPVPGDARPYAFPRFERRSLSNGISLVAAPMHRLPVVTVIAVVEAGAIADPVGREGLAALVAAMLAEGTATMDGETLTLRLERLGASFGASADWDVAVASLSVTRPRLADALALFAETLTAPSFPARELERLKGERLAEILQLRTEPRGLADEMTSHFVYAPESRYARPAGGGAAAVESITARDVGELYAARYRAAGTTLIVAGDVTVDDAAALVEEAFGTWGGSAPGAISVTDAPSAAPRGVHVVAKEDAPQSEIRVAQVGIPRIHPDYFRVAVMNAILGGLFSSRINLNLRERNAYTYGARSEFDWRRGAGPFVVSTAVASDVTMAAAREILGEIDRMRSEAVSEEELTLATSYMRGVFPIRYETTAAVATALANLVIYGLDDDYFDSYRANIAAVTTADVLEAAQRHLHPDRMRLVVVGDPAQIAAPLGELNIGPVRVFDADGSPLGA